MKSIFVIVATAIILAVQNPKDVQNRTITGTVVNEDGMGIPGATVFVKDFHDIGTITDFDGNYTLSSVPDDATTLVFTFVGLKTIEKEISENSVVNAILEPDDVSIDEIVVTAIGISRAKKVLGYSTNIINSNKAKTKKEKTKKSEPIVSGVKIKADDKNESVSITVVDVAEIEDSQEDEIEKQENIENSDFELSYFKSNPSELDIKNKMELNKEYLGREKYDKISENEFVNPFYEPLSTFSIDVDKASYSNVRRFIEDGQLPPEEAVRIEEFINYFSYNYAEPVDTFPFSVNIETADCPWKEGNKIVTIGLQGKNISEEELPPSNLVFLIDVSGSMSAYNKLPLLQASMEILVNNARPIDKIAIVTYAGSAGIKLQSTYCTKENKVDIITAISGLYSGGGTAGAAGINTAYEIAVENFISGGNNRVILSTDGDFNIGVSGTSGLVSLIEEKRKSGVYLSVMGFGMGNLNDEMMEKLSNAGNGNYAYIDDIEEAKKVFDEEFSSTLFTIAKDVKIQIEFNPAKVKAYRLIGYENRMLEAEDFDNDAIDAGEIGAGHTVTAMYEIVPSDDESNLFLASLDGFQSIVIDREELMTVKLRYKKPDEDISNLLKYSFNSEDLESSYISDNMKFISAVVEFGMILRNSAFKSDADYENVIKLAKEATKNTSDIYKEEFIELVEKAKVLK